MLRGLLRPALVLTAALCLLTGFLYPGLVTVLAQALFPERAGGSLIVRHGRVIGSALIGQTFRAAGYFHPRPSAAGAGYDGTASGGTNRGPTDRGLADSLIAGAVARVMREDGIQRGRIPSDMVTASASGLDPHVSPATALAQVSRVARARGLSDSAVRALVLRRIEPRTLGFLGEPRVNVLLLNLALDSLAGAPSAP